MLEQLRSDLKLAMTRRDRREVAVIRLLMGAIANAEAQADTGTSARVGLGNEVDRRSLDAEEVQRVLASERTAFLDAAAEYDAVDHPAQADELRARASIVTRYVT